MPYSRHLGFTLIEILIALMIISIALFAIIQTTHSTIAGQAYLENKTEASWIANNILAEAQLGLTNLPLEHLPIQMLDHSFYCDAVSNQTPDPYVTQVTITIFDNKNHQIFRLIGFRMT